MWCAEIKRSDGVVIHFLLNESLRKLVRHVVSEAKYLVNRGESNLWIPIWKNDGYTRYMINVDSDFVCYKNTDSKYVLINARKGGMFGV